MLRSEYLHSTLAQAMFAESRRDISHGCIRVSDPVGLAQIRVARFAGMDARKYSPR